MPPDNPIDAPRKTVAQYRLTKSLMASVTPPPLTAYEICLIAVANHPLQRISSSPRPSRTNGSMAGLWCWKLAYISGSAFTTLFYSPHMKKPLESGWNMTGARIKI
jgi:hypothetical protein